MIDRFRNAGHWPDGRLASNWNLRDSFIRATIGRYTLRHQEPLMGGNIVVQVIAAAVALALYFLPSILADRRKRHDLLIIALFNACLGWTVFGWLLALFWALQPNPPANVAGEVVANRRNVVLRVFSTQLVARVRARATRNAAREGSEESRR
jgi:hypothetical protein